MNIYDLLERGARESNHTPRDEQRQLLSVLRSAMRRRLRRPLPDRLFVRFRSPWRPGDPALAATKVAPSVFPIAFGTQRRMLVLNPGLRRDAVLCQTEIAVPSSIHPAVDAGADEVLFLAPAQHLHVPDLCASRGHYAVLPRIRCSNESLEQKAPEKGI